MTAGERAGGGRRTGPRVEEAKSGASGRRAFDAPHALTPPAMGTPATAPGAPKTKPSLRGVWHTHAAVAAAAAGAALVASVDGARAKWACAAYA